MNNRITDRYSDPTYILAQGYFDTCGIFRWKSNNAVPPKETVSKLSLGADVVMKIDAAREVDNAAFVEQYRIMQSQRSPEQIAEEHAEARAAMGPGVKIVNIITGERYTT